MAELLSTAGGRRPSAVVLPHKDRSRPANYVAIFSFFNLLEENLERLCRYSLNNTVRVHSLGRSTGEAMKKEINKRFY